MSSPFINKTLARVRTARGNDPRQRPTVWEIIACVDHRDKEAVSNSANGHPAVFDITMQPIVSGRMKGIIEYGCRDLEAYSVFTKIQLCFGFAPIKVVILGSQLHRDNLGRDEFEA